MEALGFIAKALALTLRKNILRRICRTKEIHFLMTTKVPSTSFILQHRPRFTKGRFNNFLDSMWIPTVILLAVWGLIVLIVNPVGEFMVNDDWAYVKFLETLRAENRLIATSWGPSSAPGGPALITHILWGLLFTHMAGFSLTTLRVSVLIMGILGSVGLLILLRVSGASRALAIWGALTLVFNPLFLSQSFTFMTDITFASIVIFSVMFIYLGVEKSRMLLIMLGLFFALLATLTRQLGIVVPLGLVVTCFLHPKGKDLGRLKILLMAVGVTVIPWLAYEIFLYQVGSTPIVQNLRFFDILGRPLSKGLPDYLVFMSGQIFHAALGYTCFLVSPVVALRYAHYIRRKVFKYFLMVLTATFALLEAGLLAGLVELPVAFYRNVIFDFGIGPILLKDTYILGIQRTTSVPKPLFYLIVYWAVLAVVMVVALAVWSLRRLLRAELALGGKPIGFLPALSLLVAIAYLGIIMLTGFHDRYLIPVCILFIVWLVSDMTSAQDFSFSPGKLMPALAPFVFLGFLSTAGVRDFMEMKRSLNKAHNYLVKELKVDPCKMDGGFEFNGYHCYRNDFKPRKGLSWWWVSREDYLITLGPLPGYRIIRTFPFERYIGQDGAIHIIQPADRNSGSD
jgi:hypothetical protein